MVFFSDCWTTDEKHTSAINGNAWCALNTGFTQVDQSHTMQNDGITWATGGGPSALVYKLLSSLLPLKQNPGSAPHVHWRAKMSFKNTALCVSKHDHWNHWKSACR